MSHSEFGRDRQEPCFSLTAMHMHPARWAERTAGRVLVVAEDEEVRRLIAASLTLEGFDVTTAADGQDCLDKVRAAAPDVITLDAAMPRLDGYQTAALLRARPETSRIKVVLIVPAHAPAQDPGVGIDAYLVKPFDPAEMIRVIRRLASAATPPCAASTPPGG